MDCICPESGCTFRLRTVDAPARFTLVVQTCFFRLRRLLSVRRQLGCEVTGRLVSVVVFSRLDYSNAILTGYDDIDATAEGPQHSSKNHT